MMVHDNGKVCVLAVTRCGHTNMYNHFGLEPYTYSAGYTPWLQSTSKRVVVLRNPYDRVKSAKRLCEIFEFRDQNIAFIDHSKPYLHMLKDCQDFSIIDFYRLSEYIQREGWQSFATYSVGGSYIPNDEYTEEDLQREYQLYCDLMNIREQMTAKEWKELTP